MLEHEGECDTPTHGDTKDVRLLNGKCIHESFGIVGHHLKRVGQIWLVGATRTTIIEREDPVFFCEPTNDAIPLREVGSKSNDQHQRLALAVYLVIHLNVVDVYRGHCGHLSMGRLIQKSGSYAGLLMSYAANEHVSSCLSTSLFILLL